MPSAVEQQLHICTETTAHAFHFAVIITTLQPDLDTRALSWLTNHTRCTFAFWVPRTTHLRSIWRQHNTREYDVSIDLSTTIPTTPDTYIARTDTLTHLQNALAPDKGNLLPAMARLPTALFDLAKVKVCRADLDPAAPMRFRVTPQHGAWRCVSAHAANTVTHAVRSVSDIATTAFVIVNGWRTLDNQTIAAVDNWLASSAILCNPKVQQGTLVPVVAPMWLPPGVLEWWAMVQLCMQLAVVPRAVVWHQCDDMKKVVHAANCAQTSIYTGFWHIEPHAWLVTRQAFCTHMFGAWREIADDLLVKSERHAHLHTRAREWMVRVEHACKNPNHFLKNND